MQVLGQIRTVHAAVHSLRLSPQATRMPCSCFLFIDIWLCNVFETYWHLLHYNSASMYVLSKPRTNSGALFLFPWKRQTSSFMALIKHLLQNIHSAKKQTSFLHKSSKLQSRPSSINHILWSHVLLFSPLIEKCKSSCWTPHHIETNTCLTFQCTNLSSLDIWRSQSVRLESTKPSSWLNMCAEYRTTYSTCCTYMQYRDRHPQD